MLVTRLLQRRAASSLLLRQQLAFCTAALPAEPQPQQQQLAAPVTTWNSLVVGEIVALAPHPAAERLSVCQVDVGDRESPLQIICGAPNVRAGAKVPVATIGTRLAIKDPESGDVKLLKIKKSKLRGEVSQGMICSEAELGLANESDGILILEDDAPVGSLVQDWGSVASRLLAKAEATAVETQDGDHVLVK
ncbi:hypothetical protein PybrP1_007936 [[Pythium] brassicae (nom. inval.)]|nr:hypothetical protein PybrP1_007936 [[Pythium] brassicae (nom. inval.)]